MSSSSVNNPKLWRERAEECRALADMMNNPDAKSAMLDVAAAYERLAEKIEAVQPALGASAFPVSFRRSS